MSVRDFGSEFHREGPEIRKERALYFLPLVRGILRKFECERRVLWIKSLLVTV